MTVDTDRREFLKGVTVAGAAVALGSMIAGASPAFAAPAAPERKKTALKRPISISAVSLLDLTPANSVLCAAMAGYDHVGIRLIPAGHTETQFPMIGDTQQIREIEKNLKETGITVLDCELIRLYPNTRVSNFVPFLETAQRLGASNVLVITHDSEFNRLADNYGRLCDIAGPYKLNMGIEFMPFCETKTVSEAVKLAKAVNRSNAGIICDPLHFDRGGGTLADLAAIPLEYLSYIQICDGSKEKPATIEGMIYQARHERLSPGKGGIDLAGYLKALPPDIPLAVECCNDTLNITTSALERARMYLDDSRTLLEKAFA